MSNFKINDSVILNRPSAASNKDIKGTITRAYSDGSIDVKVTDKACSQRYHVGETMYGVPSHKFDIDPQSERDISRNEVKKGDKLRVTYLRGDVEVVRTGTVARKAFGAAYTAANEVLVNEYPKTNEVIRLLQRDQVLQAKDLEVGDVVKIEGVSWVATKIATGKWNVIRKSEPENVFRVSDSDIQWRINDHGPATKLNVML